MSTERAEEGLGPRPVGPKLDPATQMSKARASVLEQLGRHAEPTTVGVLAAECGQHTNTVREHLDALASAGLVVRTTGPAKGRGRPAIRYTAVPPELVRPQMREYVNLVSALSDQISEAVPDARGFAVDAGRRMSTLDRPTDSLGGNAADDSLTLLTDLGFDPRVEGAPGDDDPQESQDAAAPEDESAEPTVLKVRLQECPMLEAARRNPEVVCSVHLGAVLGTYEARDESTDGVHVVPFAEPGACLAYLPVHEGRSARRKAADDADA